MGKWKQALSKMAKLRFNDLWVAWELGSEEQEVWPTWQLVHVAADS